MDLVRIIKRLRPDVTWANDLINAHSRDTMQETYQSSDPFPSHQDFVDEQGVIDTEDATQAVLDQEIENEFETAKFPTLAQADTYIENRVADMTSLALARTELEKIFKKQNRLFMKIIKDL